MAQSHGDQTALNPPTPFLFKRSLSGVCANARAGGSSSATRSPDRDPARARKTVGDVTSPPASRRRAAHDDFLPRLCSLRHSARPLSSADGQVAVSRVKPCARRSALKMARRCFSGKRCNVMFSTDHARQTRRAGEARRAAVRTSFRCRCYARYTVKSHRGYAILFFARMRVGKAHLIVHATAVRRSARLAEAIRIAFLRKNVQ